MALPVETALQSVEIYASFRDFVTYSTLVYFEKSRLECRDSCAERHVLPGGCLTMTLLLNIFFQYRGNKFCPVTQYCREA